jgi:hypothetical protein
MKKKDIWISLAIIAASAVVIYFYTQRKGYLEIDTGGADAMLQLRSSLFGTTTIHSGVAPTKVRAILHRPRQLNLSMKQDKQTWQISSSGPWANLSKIKVRGNDTTTLRCGPPFLIKPNIQKIGDQLSIDFSITGQAGEQYQKYALMNNRAMSGAKLTIKDEDGNVLESGKFQYG